MPFAKRIVGEASQDEPPFGKSCDTTASTCEVFFQKEAKIFFRQLVSLVYQADDLFSELYTECSDLVERTRKVRDRVKNLTEMALRLNAKEVNVPEGNLSTPVDSTDHPHRTPYGYECQLFTTSNRPRCVDRLHQGCDVNPVHTIRQCNLFRIDGKTGSVIFSMNPTLSTSCTSFEVLQPQKTSIAQRTVKPLREPQCTAARHDSLTASTKYVTDDDDGQSVPGDRIRILSQSQPILIVPVDVSGATYRQIHERRTRRSQSQGEGLGTLTGRAPGKLSTRRRRGGSLSVSSIIVGSTSSERVDEDFGFIPRTSDDLWRQSPSKQRWERARLIAEQEKGDSKPARRRLRQLKQRNKTRKQDNESSFCLWRKSLCSMFRPSKEDENLNDLWIEGGPETIREPMIVDTADPLPFTRSQSLPRSFRSVVRKPQGRLPGARSLTAVKSSNLEVSEPLLSPLRTLPSVFRMGKQSESPERVPSSSSAGLKRSRSLRMSQRSRSLERGTTMEVNNPDGSVVVSPHPGVSQTGALPSSVCREVIVHLPEQPWTKPFATVKLRPQSTKVEAEGCQTSSGNWSVDSACHSMHSDQMTGLLLPPGDGRSGRQARRSLDKDSAISDINQSDRLSTSSIHLAQSSCNHHLEQSSCNHHLEQSSCSESSSTTHSSVSRQTRRKRPNSCVTRVAADDLWPHEDAMSLYSLDQDGFYTSMHADSGLSKSNHTLTPGDGVETLSDHTESVSSWETNATNCEDEEDEDSKTVIYDDWVPATFGTKPSQVDVLAKEESVSKDGQMTKYEFQVSMAKDAFQVSMAKNAFQVSMAKDAFQVSKDAEKHSETSLKSFESNYNSRSVEFPSFCTITRNSSETDDLSFRGSLESDASANSLLATRLSFGSSQDQLETAGVSQTAGAETPIKSGDKVDFCLPSCDGKLENCSEELNVKRGNTRVEPKQRRTSESAIETEDPDEFTVWLPSTASSTLNSVKGILKSKKKKAFLHSKSINFGPITSLDEILNAKSTPLTIGSSDDVKSVTSYGVPAFSGSSFLGKDVHGESRLKKKDLRDKEPKAVTKSLNTEVSGVLPLKYKPVIVVKPKQRVKDSEVITSTGSSSSEVMTGYGCLGKDTISSCTGTVTVDECLARQESTPVKMDLAPVSAKLVITSPVVERTAYIENPHKRSLCTPLTPLDLQQYSGYNDPGSWYNTLPRKSSVRKKIALPVGDGLTSFIARLPESSDSLRRKKKQTRVARTLPSGQENNSESLSSDEVGNTDCFAMNLAKCGTIKRASTLTRGVGAVPTLPAAPTVTNQDSLLDKSLPSAHTSTLRRSRQSAEINHALMDCGSLLSSSTPSNAASRTSASPAIKSINKYNNDIEVSLLPDAVHLQAKSLSSQTVEQPKAFDSIVVTSKIVKQDSKYQIVAQPKVFDSISAMSSHVTQDSRNQIIDQTKAFDRIPAPSRFTSGEEGHVIEGEQQNKQSMLVRTFSSSSSDSSPDVVSSCDASLTISSTSFARSQESISSILSASEQNHIAKVNLLSSPSSDVQIDVSAALETFEPFSRHTIGKSNPKSASLASANLKSTNLASVNHTSTCLASANPETTDKDFDESQANFCDSDQTLEPSSRLMPPPSTSAVSSLAQCSATQKQSFESDSSGLGSSISGSPTTSPDSDVAGTPSSTAFPGVGQPSASPDVIPLIARSECGSIGRRKMDVTNQNARSKQTAV